MRNKTKDRVARLHLRWNDANEVFLESDPQNPQNLQVSGQLTGNSVRAIRYLPSTRDLAATVEHGKFELKEFIRNQPLAYLRDFTPPILARRITAWRRRESRFETLVQKIIGFPVRFSVEGTSLLVEVAGHEHDTRGLGRGVMSVLHLVDSIHDCSVGEAVLVDEPETSLHPTLQRRVMQELMVESMRTQIIYATHSPFFIDWDAILNGAQLVRVHRPQSGPSVISHLTTEHAKDLAGLQRNNFNPHILGTNSNEMFFLEDSVILVEGQEDVVYFLKMASQLKIKLKGNFYGWGVGGAGNMSKILQVLTDLGYTKVVGVLDADKSTIRDQLAEAFPSYAFVLSPVDDIRDKEQREAREVKGLCNTKGEIHPGRREDVEKLLKSINENL
jgi:hypothetical protein